MQTDWLTFDLVQTDEKICWWFFFNRARLMSLPRAFRINRARFIVAVGGGGWPFSATVCLYLDDFCEEIVSYQCAVSSSMSSER